MLSEREMKRSKDSSDSRQNINSFGNALQRRLYDFRDLDMCFPGSLGIGFISQIRHGLT